MSPVGRRTRVAVKRSERGASAVEFALLAPFIVILLFGIIECGRYFNATITITHAAREGVRDLALGKSPTTAQDTATAAASGLAVLPPVVLQTCPANSAGTYAEIRVDYVFAFSVPLVKNGSPTISRTARMRCGG